MRAVGKGWKCSCSCFSLLQKCQKTRSQYSSNILRQNGSDLKAISTLPLLLYVVRVMFKLNNAGLHKLFSIFLVRPCCVRQRSNLRWPLFLVIGPSVLRAPAEQLRWPLFLVINLFLILSYLVVILLSCSRHRC